MNKCISCKTWFEPAKDSNGKVINEHFCQTCLGEKLI
jgi:hypothetical protein